MQAFEPAFELTRRFPFPLQWRGLLGLLAKSVISHSTLSEAFLGAALPV
jgi:hypothetical protein